MNGETKDRKTLGLRDPSERADSAPAIRKKGRGWEISEKRLDAIHERARDMRRHPGEAHKALAARLAKEDFGKFKFGRHVVIGSAIVDFASHALGLAIAIDEEGQNDTLARRRDKSLSEVGVEVLRVPASSILEDVEAAMQTVFAAMNARYREKEGARRTHQSKYGSTPKRRTAPRRDNRK